MRFPNARPFELKAHHTVFKPNPKQQRRHYHYLHQVYVLFFFGEVHLSANKSVNPVGVFAGGHVKYVAKHEVQGRVQLLRLLNPSALFETDAQGNKACGTEIKVGDF